MITLKLDAFISLMEEKRYQIHMDGRLNIVGFRNKFGRTNCFDDTIAVYTKTDGWKASYFSATTLPGSPYLLKPVHPEGAALLVPAQYENTYSIGKHRGRYDALVQTGPVSVYRDNDRNNVYDMKERTIQRGMFGINIHRASFGAKFVGVDSAGCQVIQKADDFDYLMHLVFEQRRQGINKFTYTLVEL